MSEADLYQRLRSLEITLEPDWSGKMQRRKSEWLVSHKFSHGGRDFSVASFGNWKIGSKGEKWKSWLNGAGDDPQVKAQVEARFRAQNEQRKKAKLDYQESQAIRLWDEWQELLSAGGHIDRCPYATKKEIGELFGARVEPEDTPEEIAMCNLIVPMVDIDSKFWNFQRISLTQKRFQLGGKVSGCFHTLVATWLVELQAASTVYICEGFATAASVALAIRDPETGTQDCGGAREALAPGQGEREGQGVLEPEAKDRRGESLPPNQTQGAGATSVICTFSAGNLKVAALAIRKRFPNIRIVLCADNDAYTNVDGKPKNVGIQAAVESAREIGATVVFPTFKARANNNASSEKMESNLSDFNDLHLSEGINEVRRQIFSQLLAPHKISQKPSPEPPRLVPQEPLRNPLPSERRIAENILEQLGSSVMRQGENFFVYKKTHWVEQDSMGRDRIKQLIGRASEGRFDSKKINGCWNYIWMHMPQTPDGVDFFRPNPYAANFSNGTLHLVGKSLVFKEHSLTDYLTCVLPFECPSVGDAAQKIPTPIFDGYFERMWPEPTERESNVKLCEELIGACFMPAFPTITVFTGLSGTGKSTFLKLCNKLMSEQNVAHVDLVDFKGFNMETLVGKLVNIDTDMDTENPIKDAQVKKIIDRIPMRIGRKFQKDVLGYLPAVHLFGANDLPKSRNGTAKAYGRRFIFVSCNEVVPGERPEQCFEDTILKTERAGIIKRGLEGMRRLIESGGYYTKPGNSLRLIEEMHRASDPVAQFFEDIREGVFSNTPERVELGENRSIKPEILWEKFNRWQEQSCTIKDRIGRNAFYMRVKSMGFEKRSVQGFRTFRGVGSVNGSSEVALFGKMHS